MAKYIPLEPLLAEIERRKEKCDTFYNIALSNNAEFAKVAIEEQKKRDDRLLSFIDTLEVKEVDLEKELSTYLEVVKATDEDIDFVDFAKHFFF